jgi:hypothetical protein
MADKRHFILGVHVTDRAKNVPEVQKLFSEYGCHIRTRIGLHDVQGDYCSPNGIILLDLICQDNACQELAAKLAAVPGIEVQQMAFEG